MTRYINAAGRELIKRSESLRLSAYLCPAGIPTIGWGHTQGVKLGQFISTEQAEQLLDLDLAAFEAGVERLAPLASDNEFAAFVSFAFNLGVAALERSSLFHTYLLGRKQDAARLFAPWCHAYVNGLLTALPGLVQRRADEAALFLTPDLHGGDVPVSSQPPGPTSKAVAPESPSAAVIPPTKGT